jgi:predicted metal-dependent HD superfamily phosphohydrolase
MSLSIFFHDIVYAPTSSTNEEDSCAMWEEFVDEAGLAETEPETVLQTAVSILCTKRHSVDTAETDPVLSTSKRFSSHQFPELSEPRQMDVVRFLDMDMAILASSRDRYKEYTGQVRGEYAHVPDVAFCSGRLQFLQSVNDSGRKTFLSEEYASLEPVAVENMQWEIASLDAIKKSLCNV